VAQGLRAVVCRHEESPNLVSLVLCARDKLLSLWLGMSGWYMCGSGIYQLSLKDVFLIWEQQVSKRQVQPVSKVQSTGSTSLFSMSPVSLQFDLVCQATDSLGLTV